MLVFVLLTIDSRIVVADG